MTISNSSRAPRSEEGVPGLWKGAWNPFELSPFFPSGRLAESSRALNFPRPEQQTARRALPARGPNSHQGRPACKDLVFSLRGWRNTAEVVLFEFSSSSMKPYPSVFHAHAIELRPVIGFLSQEISMRFPYVCMHACMYVCMYVCMFVYIYIYIYVCVYIYIYTYICREREVDTVFRQPLVHRHREHGQLSEVSFCRNGPSPWELCTFKGHLEVKISNGSGIWDPQFEILQSWSYRCM